MNKMMLAAALALTMGAFAQASTCGDVDEPDFGPCALWYDVTIKVKTTAAKSKKVKIECDDPDVLCFRVTTSKTFKGIYVACDCDCESFQGASLYLWNTKEKLIYAFDNEVTWGKLWRIGKPGNKGPTDVEADLNFASDSFSASLQGFGKYDASNWRVQKISGSMVGLLCAPYCTKSCDEPVPAMVWDCDGNDDDDDTTVAFGTWNMKYNKAKSAALARTPVVKLPINFNRFAACGGEEPTTQDQ